MAKRSPATIQTLRRSLKPETWRKRVEAAEAQAAAIEAVEQARAEGATEPEALARFAPDWHRSTYHGRRRRYRAAGVEGLISGRKGAFPKTLTPEVRQAVCILRRLDPQVPVERIAEVVLAQTGVAVSITSIKRVLRAEGLNRPPGGGLRHPLPVEELQFAGAEFFKLGDQRLGYSNKLTEVLLALRDDVPEPASDGGSPDEEAVGHRDERGHFTAAYNQAQAKGEADLGPAFRSVAEKRLETDLSRRKLVHEKPETIQRKVLATLALPLLTDTAKNVQLDDYRGGHGVAEFGGPFRGETLDRFSRDQKYLGASGPLMEFHASFWLAQEPVDPAGSPAGVAYYVDGVGKALWTGHFTKSSKVSSNGRVMPCLSQIMVHTGMGTPIFWQTHSGHAGLVKETLPLLARLEAIVGNGWAVDRLTVIDSEANCVALFKQFDAQTPKRLFVTRLRENQIESPEEVPDLSPWQPFRTDEEIADGHVDLIDSKDKKHPYRARVVLIRRRRTGSLSALATNAPEEPFEAQDVAGAYFDRWPRQELRFRTFNQATKFKYVRGYGKSLVQNVTVLTALDELRAQRNRLEARIAKQTVAVSDAAQGVKTAKLRLNAAKARRARQDGLVELELAIEHTDRQALQARIETAKAERDRHTGAVSQIQEAETGLAKEQGKLAKMTKRLPEIEAEMAELATRKEIYQADTELDQIYTVYKLGFVLILEFILREWFAGMRISLDGFMRQILSLPGTRTFEGKTEHVRIKASRNQDIMRAVEAACERVNALGLVRNGRIMRLSVDWGAGAQRRGANGSG